MKTCYVVVELYDAKPPVICGVFELYNDAYKEAYKDSTVWRNIIPAKYFKKKKESV